MYIERARRIIAVQVKGMREARGWTHQELADKAGLTESLVRGIEEMTAHFDISELKKLAHALDVALIVRFEPTKATMYQALSETTISIPKPFDEDLGAH